MTKVISPSAEDARCHSWFPVQASPSGFWQMCCSQKENLSVKFPCSQSGRRKEQDKPDPRDTRYSEWRRRVTRRRIP